MQKLFARNPTHVTTALWIIGFPMILGFYSLSNTSNTGQFQNLTIFFMLYVASLLAIVFIHVDAFDLRTTAQKLRAFWTDDIDRRRLGWIGIGIIGVFAVVGLTLAIGTNIAPSAIPIIQILGIALAGCVMMFCFLKTNSILVPIIIHGTYNSFIVFLQQMPLSLSPGQLNSLPISVPQIGVNFFQNSQVFGRLYSEFIWQYTLVATGEEFLKLAVLYFSIGAIAGKWLPKGVTLLISAVISIAIWTSFHSVVAIKLVH